jgi:hypothetical protein
LAALLLTACGPIGLGNPIGLIYSDTVVPYSRRFDATPAGTKHCVINSHQVREPISGYNIYAEWSTGYILNEARKAGIKNIYYMDKRTLSFLIGIYKRESLLIYGD